MSGIEVVALVTSIVGACVKTASYIKEYQDEKKNRPSGETKNNNGTKIVKSRNKKAVVQQRYQKKIGNGMIDDTLSSSGVVVLKERNHVHATHREDLDGIRKSLKKCDNVAQEQLGRLLKELEYVRSQIEEIRHGAMGGRRTVPADEDESLMGVVEYVRRDAVRVLREQEKRFGRDGWFVSRQITGSERGEQDCLGKQDFWVMEVEPSWCREDRFREYRERSCNTERRWSDERRAFEDELESESACCSGRSRFTICPGYDCDVWELDVPRYWR